MPIVGGILAALPGLDVEVVGLTAALVDEVAGEIEIAALGSKPVKLYERQLDLLVAAISALLVRTRTKPTPDMIGIASHRVEQGVLAGGLRVGHCCLDEMAGAIKLVPVAQFRPPPRRLPALEEAVEVTVGLLRLGDPRNDVVDAGIELGVGMHGERIARRLDPFGNVGI